MSWIFVHLPQRISYWYRKAYLAMECTWHAWIQSWDLISICAREELYPEPSVNILSSSSRSMLGMTQKFSILKIALHNMTLKITIHTKWKNFPSFNQRESMCIFQQNDILSLPDSSLGFFPLFYFHCINNILCSLLFKLFNKDKMLLDPFLFSE